MAPCRESHRGLTGEYPAFTTSAQPLAGAVQDAPRERLLDPGVPGPVRGPVPGPLEARSRSLITVRGRGRPRGRPRGCARARPALAAFTGPSTGPIPGLSTVPFGSSANRPLDGAVDGPVRDTLHRSVNGDVAGTPQACPAAQSARRRDIQEPL
eukprot:gene17047-biopygen3781